MGNLLNSGLLWQANSVALYMGHTKNLLGPDMSAACLNSLRLTESQPPSNAVKGMYAKMTMKSKHRTATMSATMNPAIVIKGVITKRNNEMSTTSIIPHAIVGATKTCHFGITTFTMVLWMRM